LGRTELNVRRALLYASRATGTKPRLPSDEGLLRVSGKKAVVFVATEEAQGVEVALSQLNGMFNFHNQPGAFTGITDSGDRLRVKIT
jgi:hypothetical protein